jgi:hypothetical protein
MTDLDLRILARMDDPEDDRDWFAVAMLLGAIMVTVAMVIALRLVS